jgi:hypothetical protein
MTNTDLAQRTDDDGIAIVMLNAARTLISFLAVEPAYTPRFVPD